MICQGVWRKGAEIEGKSLILKSWLKMERQSHLGIRYFGHPVANGKVNQPGEGTEAEL